MPNNLNLYGYAHQKPVVANDPSGEWINFVIGGLKGAAENVVIQHIEMQAGLRDAFSWGELAVDTAISTATSGTGNTARNATRVARAVDAGRTGDRAQGAASASRVARSDAPADVAQQGVRQTDEVVDAGQGADFIVTPDGTAVRNSADGARADLERAGFKGNPTTQTSESGTLHSGVPGADGAMDVRIMDGQSTANPNRGPRVVTRREGTNDPIRPDGSNFRANETKSQRQQESHIHLDNQ